MVVSCKASAPQPFAPAKRLLVGYVGGKSLFADVAKAFLLQSRPGHTPAHMQVVGLLFRTILQHPLKCRVAALSHAQCRRSRHAPMPRTEAALERSFSSRLGRSEPVPFNSVGQSVRCVARIFMR
jgi:hypothetical protein